MMSVTTFEGRIEGYTGAALRFHGVYWEGPLWFPLSQVEIIEDNPDTGHVVLRVRDWLTKKRGMLEFTHYTLEEIKAMDAQ
jgi:hypothetical protein